MTAVGVGSVDDVPVFSVGSLVVIGGVCVSRLVVIDNVSISWSVIWFYMLILLGAKACCLL